MPRTDELPQDVEKRRTRAEREITSRFRALARQRQFRDMVARSAPAPETAPVEYSQVEDVEIGPAHIEEPSPLASRDRTGLSLLSPRSTAPRAEIQTPAVRETRRRIAEQAAREAHMRRSASDFATQAPARRELGRDGAGRAIGMAAADTASFGVGDEIAGGILSVIEDRPYREQRDRVRADLAQTREEHPTASGVGDVIGVLPSFLIPPATAETVVGRLAQAGGTGMALGAVEGYGRSEREDPMQQARDAGRGALYGTAGGVIAQGVGELAQAGGRAMRGEPQDRFLPGGPSAPRQPLRQTRTPEQAERIRTDPELRGLEDQRVIAARDAARHRLMAISPGATRGDLDRALDGYPGGAEQLADDLRAFGIVDDADRFAGIVPEAADQAQQRARFMREDAGRAIGAADERMASRPRFDPDTVQIDDSVVIEPPGYVSPQPRVETDRTGAVGGAGQRRAQQREAAMRAEATDVRRQILRRRLAEGDLVDPADVNMRNVAEDLRRQAQVQRAQLSPMGDRRAAELEALAARFESEGGGRIPFDAPETSPSARRVLAGQDEAARFGGSSPDAQRPYAAEQARQVRRSVRGEMDESMRRVMPPEEFAQHQMDRRRFGAAATATDLADQGAARASGNRQLSLTDTIAGSNGGVLDQVLGVIRNRFIRGREHAFMAQIGEAQADRLAREVSRRLAGQGNARAAARLDVARRRGGPAAGVMIREWMESDPNGAQEVAGILMGGQAPSQPSTPVPVDEDAELLRNLMPAEQAPTELSDEEEARLLEELL